MNKKIALITGILGQDGTYLSNLLITKGYRVFGTTSKNFYSKVLNQNITILEEDVTDYDSVKKIILNLNPQLVFNLAGYSNVFYPWQDLNNVLNLTCKIPENFISVISEYANDTHFCQASSCLVFGKTKTIIQNEETPREPLYPYGIAKNYIDYLIKAYRENKNLHFTSAIFYNHESPYRGNNFFTKKIINFAKLKNTTEKLQLNNLNVKKDIGFAGDYVDAMYKIATATIPDDYIVSTNTLVSLNDIINYVCDLSNKDLWKDIIVNPNEGNNAILCGDNSKIKNELKWSPTLDWKKTIKMIWENN
jgi:GDPmannose 4,6-dehydratase